MRKILILFCLALLLISAVPASASSDPNQNYNTSGIVEYQLSESASYTRSGTFTPAQVFGLYPYQISHRFTDAQYLYMVGFKNELSRKNSAIPVNVQSSFTATVDGIYYGSGQIVLSDRYVDNKVALYYYFNDINSTYAESLTGTKIITISTNLDFVNNVVSRTSQNRDPNEPTAAQPTRAIASGSGNFNSLNGYIFGDVQVITSFGKFYQNPYTYTYNSNTKTFTLSVNRSTSASKLRIYDFSGTEYVNENLYSNARFDLVKPLQNGVILDVTYDFDGGTTRTKQIHLASTTTAPGSSSSSISWDKKTYNKGETGQITYQINNFNDNVFDYYLHIFDSSSTKVNHPISSSSGSYSYTFNPNAISGYYAARIEAYYANGTRVYLEGDSAYYSNEVYRVTFSQHVYTVGDTAIISYYGAPAGSFIYLHGQFNNQDIVTANFTNLSGNGYVTYEFTDNNAGFYYARLIYNSYNLAMDTCKVATGDKASMYGYVYDADTLQPIPGAYVYSQTDGVSDTTDADGFYGVIVSKGYQSIAVSAPGTYQSIIQNVSVAGSTNQNFHLTYIPIEGYARIYGYVYDYNTNMPLTGVSVSATMSNTTMTRTATATTNQYGYYDLIGLPISSTGSIRFQKTGYTDFRGNSILINTSASVQTTLRYHDVFLFPVGSSGGGTGGGTGGGVNITDPSTTPQDFTGIANNLLNFMLKPAFWGFIFWFGGTVAMIQRRDRRGDAAFDLKQVGVVSVILANILAIIGMWAPYTWYVVVVSWLALAVGFVGFGRQIGGSEGGAN